LMVIICSTISKSELVGTLWLVKYFEVEADLVKDWTFTLLVSLVASDLYKSKSAT